MHIRSVDAFHLRAPLDQPFRFSQFSYTQREAMLVRVATDEGSEGWGEAYGPAAVTAAVVREFLGPLVLDRDPRAVESIWALLYARSLDYGQKGVMLAAIPALDIASWAPRWSSPSSAIGLVSTSVGTSRWRPVGNGRPACAWTRVFARSK